MSPQLIDFCSNWSMTSSWPIDSACVRARTLVCLVMQMICRFVICSSPAIPPFSSRLKFRGRGVWEGGERRGFRSLVSGVKKRSTPTNTNTNTHTMWWCHCFQPGWKRSRKHTGWRERERERCSTCFFSSQIRRTSQLQIRRSGLSGLGDFGAPPERLKE